MRGPPCPHQPLHDKINPKDCCWYCPLVIQGFSNFLGLFQVITANPVKNPPVSLPGPRCWIWLKAPMRSLAVHVHDRWSSDVMCLEKLPSRERTDIWVFPKIGVPKMDGENNGKPYYIKWMIWGHHYSWKHPYFGRKGKSWTQRWLARRGIY